MKLGLKLKIDVSKLDKERFFRAESGAIYADLTTFIDTDKPGKYGDHGIISHQQTKEEREQKVRLPIVGNATVFWTEQANSAPAQNANYAEQSGSNIRTNSGDMDTDFDDCPF